MQALPPQSDGHDAAPIDVIPVRSMSQAHVQRPFTHASQLDNHAAPTIETDNHDPLSTTRSDATASYGELLGGGPTYVRDAYCNQPGCTLCCPQDAMWQPEPAAAPEPPAAPSPVHDAGAVSMPPAMLETAGPSGSHAPTQPLIRVRWIGWQHEAAGNHHQHTFVGRTGICV